MAKNWWFKFDFKVWRTDSNLRRCSLETRGFWLEALCVMHEADCYELQGTIEEVARLIGCFPQDVTRAAIELKRTGTAEVEIGSGQITLSSRRLQRETAERKAARKRQAKFRENGGGDPERWSSVRAVILTRDGKRCAYCGKYATTVDHVHPRSKGGTHEGCNLVACCKTCNFTKNNRTLEEAGMSFHTSFNHKQLASNTQVTPPIVISNKKEVINKSKKEEERETLSASSPLKRKATRIPDSFELTQPMRQYAAEKRPDVDVSIEHERFINYWTAKAGKDACKLDWPATWRNWILGATTNGVHQYFRPKQPDMQVGKENGNDEYKLIPPCEKCGDEICLGGQACADRVKAIAGPS